MNKSQDILTIESMSQKIGIDCACIEQNICLKKRTWIHRGGIAKWWLTPKSYENLVKTGTFLFKEHIKFDIIGHTSNIYFTNSYNPEVILDTKHVKGFYLENDEIICEAGTPTAHLAKECVRMGICGYEGLIDLPGTIGAAIVNNSGCFGCEMSKLVRSVEILTREGVVQLTDTDLKYSHRNSAIKSKEISGIVLRVRLDAKEKTKNIEELQAIATRNHEIRVRTQERPAHNLGSTFANVSFRRNYLYFIVRSIVKILDIFKANHHTMLKVQKQAYLRLLNKSHLTRYISDKNMNTYLFLDDIADLYFTDYVNFIETIYDNPQLEIEIK